CAIAIPDENARQTTSRASFFMRGIVMRNRVRLPGPVVYGTIAIAACQKAAFWADGEIAGVALRFDHRHQSEGESAGRWEAAAQDARACALEGGRRFSRRR